MGHLGAVLGTSGLWKMQEFSEANSLKKTPLGELILEFQSLCLVLRLPARITGFTPLKHLERSASTKQSSDDK